MKHASPIMRTETPVVGRDTGSGERTNQKAQTR
jgi:hypothetical protein